MMKFEKLDAFLSTFREKYGVPACECIVRRNGVELYHRTFGFSDAAGTVPAAQSDNYFFYSMSKLYTCTAVMQLVERGALKLDDNVSKYLPEYENMTVKTEDGAVPAARQITITDLLTMTAGLNYDLDMPPIKKLRAERNDDVSTRDIIRAIAENPLDFHPGEHFQYSLCHDVLGAVIEVVSGLRLSEYMRRNIFEPLGIRQMGYTSCRPDGSFSTLYCYNYDNGKTEPVELVNAFQLSSQFESGGAGMCGNASSYILLPAALAEGTQILSRESVDLMRRNWLNDRQKKDFNNMKAVEYSYGLGVRTRVQKGAAGTPVGEFGWDGAAGSYFLIDPENGISITYCEHILNHYCAYDAIQNGIRDLAYEDMGF